MSAARPGRGRGLALALTLGALAGLSSITAARPQLPLPGAPRTPNHLRRAPIERALPGPDQVAVGRFLSERLTARGPRARGRTGDYYVRSARLLAVLRARDGALIDLAVGPDFVDGFGWSALRVCRGKERHAVELTAIWLLGGRRPSLEVRGRVSALGLEVRTTYHIPAGSSRLELETELRNAGRGVLADVGVCDELGITNTRLQVPGLGEVRTPGEARAPFCGRSEAGVSYLLASAAWTQFRLVLDLSTPIPAFDPTIFADHGRRALAPQERLTVRRLLAVRRGALHEALAEALAGTAVKTRRVSLQLGGLEGRRPAARVVLRRGGAPFLTTVASSAMDLVLPEPDPGKPGYQAALLLPGVGEGRAASLPSRGRGPRLRPPARGWLQVRLVDEQGAPAAGKLLLEGCQGTPTPAFGSDEGLRLERVVYTAGSEELELAPGCYQVVATRGFAHELARATVTVPRDATATLELRPRRVVRTPGWLSADLHLHTASSHDSPVTLAERVLAAQALGVDLLALTDHNVISPAPVEARLDGPASRPASRPASSGPLVLSGQELTSEGRLAGHFNLFPLPVGPALAALDLDPARSFAEALRRSPSALLQVNHPRMGSIGYFDLMKLDPASGRAAPGYARGYHLLEVFNGDQLTDLADVERVLADWYALLDRGERVTATGNSDAHRLPFQDAGYPRNLVLWDPAGQAKGAPTTEQALVALRAGRSLITTGPTVRFTANGQPLGALVPGRRPVRLRIEVEAPSWIDVSSVTLLERGRPLARFTPSRKGTQRLAVTHEVRPQRDTWYVVLVRGERPDPTQLRAGVLPFALTNPIWVDADGDGRFTPPRAPGSQPAAATSTRTPAR